MATSIYHNKQFISGLPVAMMVLLCCTVAGISGQCLVDPSVSKTDKLSVEETIQRLKPVMGTTMTVAGEDGVEYSVGVCTDATIKAAFDQTAVVKVQENNNTLIGRRNRTLAVAGDNWLEFRFLGSKNYSDSPCLGVLMSARLLIVCDQTITGRHSLKLSYSPVSGSNCFTQLSGSHSLACLHPHQQGLGGFSILLIILVVSFATYFLLGMAYLRLVKGAKGIDQIPNRMFWFRFGNGFADCMGSMCRCDRYCGVSNSGSVDDYISSPSSGGQPQAYSDGGVAGSRDGSLLGGTTRGYHEGYVQVPGHNVSDRDELLTSSRQDSDTNLIQP